MSIKNQPTIYKGPTIYNVGGGGEPQFDYEDYRRFTGLKRITENNGLTGHFGIVDKNDTIEISMYIDFNYNFADSTVFTLQGGFGLSLQRRDPQLSINLSGYTELINFNNPNYASFKIINNKISVNAGTEYILGPERQNNKYIDFSQVFYYGQWINSVLFSFIIKDDESKLKYSFIPALRRADSKKGLLEIVTNTFIPVFSNADFDLVGEIT